MNPAQNAPFKNYKSDRQGFSKDTFFFQPKFLPSHTLPYRVLSSKAIYSSY